MALPTLSKHIDSTCTLRRCEGGVCPPNLVKAKKAGL